MDWESTGGEWNRHTAHFTDERNKAVERRGHTQSHTGGEWWGRVSNLGAHSPHAANQASRWL